MLIICQLINCYQTVNWDSEKNRSTILQLLTVMNEWTEALDDGIYIDTVYLDFRKAFDSVPHKRLIKKLEGYGIKGILLEWFKNFLNGRQQRVVINGKTSDWTKLDFLCFSH